MARNPTKAGVRRKHARLAPQGRPVRISARTCGNRALVHHVAEWSRASGFETLTLTTFRHLPWNAPFYASVGFAEIPERDRGPELREALAKEATNGFDPSKRVAMRLDVTNA